MAAAGTGVSKCLKPVYLVRAEVTDLPEAEAFGTSIWLGVDCGTLPMLLAALGKMMVEKTGLLHLRLGDMMALGLGIGFVSVYQTGFHAIGFVAETYASALLSMVFAGLV